MRKAIIMLIIVLLQLSMHLNIHFRHNQLEKLLESYNIQERNARIILSCDLLSRIDSVEHNIKNIMDENLTVVREEIEYNIGVLEVLSDVLKEHNIELE